MSLIRIRKADNIRGKTLRLRNASITDAAFILSLRVNSNKAQHLSKVTGDLRDQENWLRGYEVRDGEAYFIIEDLQGTPLGTIRLYDQQDDSFCWGSWILIDGAPANAAIESALIIYTYALNSLGFCTAHFQVHKSNERVCKFHERFGANRMSEDYVQYSYKLENSAIQLALDKYRRFLPDGIVIEGMSK